MKPLERISYDRVPYPSNPFPQTHPDRLATLATLYGMSPAPPPIATARILEIGCAQADNLIPLALQLPDARLVGIDASAAQIATAVAAARELDVTNLDFHHMDLVDFPAAMGTFDYVICHGVYSWVPDAVRDSILSLLRRHLAPNGIAYVSYNTYPGWRLLGTVRDILLYDSRDIEEPEAKVHRARSTIAFLLEAIPEELALRGIVKTVSASISHPRSLAYVAHEYFEPTNDPVYFHQFAARAAAHGLQFLSEAEIEHMQTLRLPPAAQPVLKQLESQPVEREQYLDFLRCRPFRQTLLCHADVSIDRQIRRERLEPLYFASTATAAESAALASNRELMTFRCDNGSELKTNHPLAKGSMLHLQESWPQAVPFGELEIAARARTSPTPIMVYNGVEFERDRNEWLDDLLQVVVAGLVQVHVAPPRLTTEVTAYPTASRWARWRAAKGSSIENLWHRSVQMDDVQRRLITLLDGTRTHAQIVNDMIAVTDSERLMIFREGRKLEDPGERRSAIAVGVPQELKLAARKGLLIA